MADKGIKLPATYRIDKSSLKLSREEQDKYWNEEVLSPKNISDCVDGLMENKEHVAMLKRLADK